MFHKSVKRNKDTICKEKTKASQEQIIYLKKGTSIIQAPSPVIINMVTSKKPQHWFPFGTQNRKLTSREAASPGAITPHQSQPVLTPTLRPGPYWPDCGQENRAPQGSYGWLRTHRRQTQDQNTHQIPEEREQNGLSQITYLLHRMESTVLK